ncbi:Scr1 family TA system antitoxin-like transcriptional regulator [Saccharomonospora sp.]|uniref:Scr1 family TA system antitoxin-like transcriptional regulator n=1 Tax=Saccharomonospora sp. TaxID=33913 RepID=UPI0034246696
MRAGSLCFQRSEKTVAGYREAFDTLCRSAMSPAESMQLIADALEQKETQP